MILMIDNFDSFTYNLVQYLQGLKEEVRVLRNDAVTIPEIEAMAPACIVISPGPKTPDEAGISLETIRHFAGKIPLLGVCLGHQAIGQVYGAKVVKALEPVHGKVHPVQHLDIGVFKGLPNPLKVTRYHSLVLERETLPEALEVTAWTEAGEIMGVRHRNLPVEGVQFHPEAILTEKGMALLQNFLWEACQWKREQ